MPLDLSDVVSGIGINKKDAIPVKYDILCCYIRVRFL